MVDHELILLFLLNGEKDRGLMAMGSDEIKCPRCAETIKQAASQCRFCNFDLVAPAKTAASPSATAVPISPPKSGMGVPAKFGIGCLGFIILLAVIGTISGGDSSKPSSSANAEKGAPLAVIETTPRELVRAYKENEAAAQTRFGSSPLKVTAKIESIDLGLGDEPFLVLAGGEMFMNPQAKLDAASQARAGELKKGQQVILICQSVSELAGTPMLDDCAVQ